MEASGERRGAKTTGVGRWLVCLFGWLAGWLNAVVVGSKFVGWLRHMALLGVKRPFSQGGCPDHSGEDRPSKSWPPVEAPFSTKTRRRSCPAFVPIREAAAQAQKEQPQARFDPRFPWREAKTRDHVDRAIDVPSRTAPRRHLLRSQSHRPMDGEGENSDRREATPRRRPNPELPPRGWSLDRSFAWPPWRLSIFKFRKRNGFHQLKLQRVFVGSSTRPAKRRRGSTALQQPSPYR